MPTERVRPASLNGRHGFELSEADMPCIGSAPCGAELSEYVSNLQLVPGQRVVALLQSAFECLVL